MKKSNDHDGNWRDYVRVVSRNFRRGKVTRTLLNFKGAIAKNGLADGVPQVCCLE